MDEVCYEFDTDYLVQCFFSGLFPLKTVCTVDTSVFLTDTDDRLLYFAADISAFAEVWLLLIENVKLFLDLGLTNNESGEETEWRKGNMVIFLILGALSNPLILQTVR